MCIDENTPERRSNYDIAWYCDEEERSDTTIHRDGTTIGTLRTIKKYCSIVSSWYSIAGGIDSIAHSSIGLGGYRE